MDRSTLPVLRVVRLVSRLVMLFTLLVLVVAFVSQVRDANVDFAMLSKYGSVDYQGQAEGQHGIHQLNTMHHCIHRATHALALWAFHGSPC
jgi:hypothetical protein